MKAILERVAGTVWYFDGQIFDLPALSAVTATSPAKDISGDKLYLTVKPAPIVEGAGTIDVSMTCPADANSEQGLFRFKVSDADTDIAPGRYEIQILLLESDQTDPVPVFTGQVAVKPRLRTELP